MRTKLFAGWLAIFVLIAGNLTAALAAGPGTVEQWGIYEIELKGPTNGNPFLDVRFSAAFTDGCKTIEVPGFYDGDGVYRVRFMPMAIDRDQTGRVDTDALARTYAHWLEAACRDAPYNWFNFYDFWANADETH